MAPNNALPVWGNEKTMNLNTLILTNIQSSPYFKVNLFELKTYHEVIDEIYYKVSHLEPWEKGSRKTAGQTGMCGGVRGVGAGGIVSSAYCLLYKLYTLKLTKKQLIGLITHADSPYIRGLGFMYIRYTQPPPDLWEWYEEYLDDEEEIDVKAGGGHVITIGELCRQFLVKLEWYSTLFPRIPVPVQKSLQEKIKENPPIRPAAMQEEEEEERPPRSEEVSFGEAERMASRRSPPRRRSRSPRRSPQRRSPMRRSPPPRRRSPRRSRSPRNSRSPRRSPCRYDKERGRDHERKGTSNDDFARELEREKDRQRREKEKSHRHEKTRDRKKERRSRSRERRRSHSRERKTEKSDRHKSRSAEEHKDRKRSPEEHKDRKRSPEEHKDRKRSPEEHKDRKRSRSRERKEPRSKDHKKSKSHEHKRDGKKSKDRGQERHGRVHDEHNRDSDRNGSPRRKNNENGDS